MKRRTFISLVGGAATWPLAARAQLPTMPVIGFLAPGTPNAYAHLLDAFRQGLDETGYVEHRNVGIEYRWAEGKYDQLPGLAADLVRRRVAVIAASSIVGAQAARMATSSIPIVFSVGTDPVKDGLVTNINRPGGNATGISNLTALLAPKRFQIVQDLVPTSTIIAILINPITPGSDLEDAEQAARDTGRELLVLRATREREFEANFKTLVQRGAGALIVASDPFFRTRSYELVELAAR
jgi:putative ABC transport system substrate-binding protein